MQRIGLIDVDGHNFPSLPLMKLSAWHKDKGDTVEWYDPMLAATGAAAGIIHYSLIYMAKVFTFSPDYLYPLIADDVIRSGTGYFYPDGGEPLPNDVEHTYPDYSLYPHLTHETAYGFLTRGCPGKCGFCCVWQKEGCKSVKVADLSEFWRGQKNIKLLDPNLIACSDSLNLLQQLVSSNAHIDFTQGIGIKFITSEKTELIKKMKIKQVHFAWDMPEEESLIVPKLEAFARETGWNRNKMGVYVLSNYNSTIEQDLHRIYTIRDLGFSPYLMIYEKERLPKGHKLRKMQRWVNSRFAFYSCPNFEDYKS